MEYTPALMYVCKKGGFIVDMMPLFSYRTGNSVIHKLPPTLKIILLPCCRQYLAFFTVLVRRSLPVPQVFPFQNS